MSQQPKSEAFYPKHRLPHAREVVAEVKGEPELRPYLKLLVFFNFLIFGHFAVFWCLEVNFRQAFDGAEIEVVAVLLSGVYQPQTLAGVPR